MTIYTVYFANGQIDRTGTCSDEDFEHNVLPNELFINELSNPMNQYVENGVLIDMPEKPAGYYVFDYDIKQWVFDEQAAIYAALQQRDFLLKDGPDRISPLWWSSMTPEQQAEWSSYRQALLDITSQPDYPSAIIWPIKPGMGE